MKRKALTWICGILVIVMAAENLHALGLGVYGQARRGRTHADVHWLGAGVLLDSALARDTLFNLRFQVGFGTTMKNEDLFASFGFGLIRNENFRFWLGPQVGMSFQRYSVMPMPVLGPVAGLNWNPGDLLTVTVDGGYRLLILFEENNTMGWIDGEPFINVAVMFRINDRYSGPDTSPSVEDTSAAGEEITGGVEDTSPGGNEMIEGEDASPAVREGE